MPRKLTTCDGSTFAFRDYMLPPVAGDQVRVRVEFAAPKHGTEKHSILGSPFSEKRWDPQLRMFLPETGDGASGGDRPERTVGNMVVGTVTEVGPEVERRRPGDRVFGYGPVCEEHQQPESRWWPQGELKPVDAVCVDPAHVAFVAVRDGNLRVGDTVAVFGLGAIGLCVVQLARVSGAQQVLAVDPLALRRNTALKLGADAVFDPATTDAGLAIKQATGGWGVDVAVETSGTDAALHEAIRCLRQCGTVVHVAWGPHQCSALRLDEEFHLNRPVIIGSQAWEGWGNPDRDHPRWTPARAFATTVELFRRKQVTGRGIVTPIVSFAAAPEALRDIFARPETTIKMGVSVTG